MTASKGFFSQLSKTRQSISTGLMSVFSSKPKISEALFDEIEDHLIMADLGIHTSHEIVSSLRGKAKTEKYTDSQHLIDGLRQIILGVLNKAEVKVEGKDNPTPHVILMVGVNGVGKTTTLAKIAKQLKDKECSVMMAACDTFRAAAIEQLQTWGNRLDIPVVAQSHGSDAAAVAFDAYSAARAREMDYLLIDSAGRQHTQGDLMEQLSKIKRVLGKVDVSAPHDVYLTVDAGNGQNVLSQVENFNNAIALTGLCVTKLDGTARGGIVVSLADQFNLPIKYVGVGEGISDIRSFDADEFTSALLPALSDVA